MPTTTPSKKNPWLQFLLPLIICLLFVLALIGYRQYKGIRERTRIQFSIVPPESRSANNLVVRLDDQPVAAGQKISLGSHTFTITNPKFESFRTNFSVWFGAIDLGQIHLKRANGKLTISSVPPAGSVVVVGPDYSAVMKDVSKTNLIVPADNYQVTAHYPHSSQAKNISVAQASPTACAFEPHFGAIKVTGNYAMTTIELTDDSRGAVERGYIPMIVTDLPPGSYHLKASFKDHQQTKAVSVNAGRTNDAAINFEFGAVRFASSPAGADVRDASGNWLGKTPLLLTEQLPQTFQVKLQMAGFEPATLNIIVTANQTNNIETNLVSTAFVAKVNAARSYLAGTNYEQAAAAIKSALSIAPANPDALDLQRQIAGLWLVKQAKDSATAGDYVTACADLEKSLLQLPDLAESKALLAQYKQQVPQQLAQEKEQRLKAPQTVFDDEMKISLHSTLFEDHELKTTKPWKEVEAAIAKAFESGDPAFKITHHNSGQPEVFDMDAREDFLTYLKTSAGYRKVVIVGGQITDTETEIHFKVYEYKAVAAIKFSIGNLIGTPASVNYLPIGSAGVKMTDELKKRVKEGVQIATSRIQEAIGQP